METKTKNRDVMVTLGGQEYAIKPLNIRQSRAWREQFANPFQAVIGVLQNAGRIELTNPGDLGALLSQVGGLLLGSMDLVIDALFAYSPELRADEDAILDNATDEEAVAALWEVLKLAYPFGSILQTLNGGPGSRGPLKKSPAPNGTLTRRK